MKIPVIDLINGSIRLEFKSFEYEQMKDFIDGSLLNDEYSSDQELYDHFVSEGVPEELAEKAIANRGNYLKDMFFSIFPERKQRNDLIKKGINYER